jgi:hypothetical protein
MQEALRLAAEHALFGVERRHTIPQHARGLQAQRQPALLAGMPVPGSHGALPARRT